MLMRSRVILLAVLLCSTLLAPSAAVAQSPADSSYVRSDTTIPMRDGVRLHVVIEKPATKREALPILLLRTPYGADNAVQNGFPTVYLKELAADGYLFVFQDIRGRYKSEGAFAMNRPLRATGDTAGIDETTDTFDTIEWLIRNLPNNNGRVGALGISYPGWLTLVATIRPHPALRVASPQGTMTDTWLGDDFFHNGAFRLSYGLEYVYSMETGPAWTDFGVGAYDMYDWYLRQGPLSNITRFLKGTRPTWNAFVAHPNYDAYWRDRASQRHLPGVTVPTLNVGGWWDQEDILGPQIVYATLEPRDSAKLNHLVMGPWNHGGWGRSDGHSLGEIDFGSATARYFRERIQAPFFAHYLKQGRPDTIAEAVTFEGGSNTWRSFDAWPPRSATARKLYLHADGKLSFDSPGATGSGFDSYVSDPARPVPYRPRPVQPTYYPKGSDWSSWMVMDQRFVHNRPDVLSWQTEPLKEDVAIAGDIVAHLFSSTSGTDSDWIVKLIDVYPDEVPENPKLGGYQLMVAGEILRGRFRRSFERPEPIPANRVLEYRIGLHQQNHRFRKGHRIMVQVQSTWFPLYDRNPQAFVPNIFQARASDYRPATQRIFRSPRYASHVVLPVLEE